MSKVVADESARTRLGVSLERLPERRFLQAEDDAYIETLASEAYMKRRARDGVEAPTIPGSA